MKTGDVLGLLKKAFQEWKSGDSAVLGAALAYYTVFSLAPLLLIALSIAGLDVFLLITIFFALLAVIGKVKVINRRKHSVNDPDYSPLFFGNYGDISYEEYARNFE